MKLEGIIPPLITPLLGRDRLDVEGLERLVGHMVAGGIHGLFALGSTGEGPNLSYRLRAEPFNRFYSEDRTKVAAILKKLNPDSNETTSTHA